MTGSDQSGPSGKADVPISDFCCATGHPIFHRSYDVNLIMGGNAEVHLFAWEKVCKPHGLGGLNICNCLQIHEALLAKQLESLFSPAANQWKDLILDKIW